MYTVKSIIQIKINLHQVFELSELLSFRKIYNDKVSL